MYTHEHSSNRDFSLQFPIANNSLDNLFMHKMNTYGKAVLAIQNVDTIHDTDNIVSRNRLLICSECNINLERIQNFNGT